MKTFIDTSALYALLDRDDDNHKTAKAAWTKILRAENILVTSNYVLIETFALLQNRLGVVAVRAFQEDIVPILNIEFINPEVHQSGTAALLAASKRNLSLVDCISFEIMRALGIKTVFAFDAHFKDVGFQAIP
ncbi:MAG: PIN domain-containing protein [Candidatus Aminicenantes bacterium]|nr:PIN domain-containing protein [Candidatus Aminicenantes bacterium]